MEGARLSKWCRHPQKYYSNKAFRNFLFVSKNPHGKNGSHPRGISIGWDLYYPIFSETEALALQLQGHEMTWQELVGLWRRYSGAAKMEECPIDRMASVPLFHGLRCQNWSGQRIINFGVFFLTGFSDTTINLSLTFFLGHIETGFVVAIQTSTNFNPQF